jgi:hypothetical protein
MITPDDVPPIKALRTLQIITGALLLGVVVFTAVVVVLGTNGINVGGAGAGVVGGVAGNDTPLISIVALMIFAVQVPMSFVVPGMQTRDGLNKIMAGTWRTPRGSNPSEFEEDAAKLMVLRQTTLITSLALLEGAALFAGVAYLIEGRVFILAVPAVVVLQMLTSFPTEYRVRTWLEAQIDRLELLRQEGGVGAA